jgi:hypothetical protein
MAELVDVYGSDLDRSIYPGPLILHALGGLVAAGAFLDDKEAMVHIATPCCYKK